MVTGVGVVVAALEFVLLVRASSAAISFELLGIIVESGLELAVVLTSLIESEAGLCAALDPGTKVFRQMGQEAC